MHRKYIKAMISTWVHGQSNEPRAWVVSVGFIVAACTSRVEGTPPQDEPLVPFPDPAHACELYATCGGENPDCLRVLPKVRVPTSCANAVTSALTCEALTATDPLCSPPCEAPSAECVDAHTLRTCDESKGGLVWFAFACPNLCDADKRLCR